MTSQGKLRAIKLPNKLKAFFRFVYSLVLSESSKMLVRRFRVPSAGSVKPYSDINYLKWIKSGT